MSTATTSSSNPTEDTLVEATIACPGTKKVVGGGGEITTSNTAIRSQVHMFRSYPLSATQWRASAVVNSGFSGQTVTVTAYAICATA